MSHPFFPHTLPIVVLKAFHLAYNIISIEKNEKSTRIKEIKSGCFRKSMKASRNWNDKK
jgi:hypothetical protein